MGGGGAHWFGDECGVGHTKHKIKKKITFCDNF